MHRFAEHDLQMLGVMSIRCVEHKLLCFHIMPSQPFLASIVVRCPLQRLGRFVLVGASMAPKATSGPLAIDTACASERRKVRKDPSDEKSLPNLVNKAIRDNLKGWTP